MSDSRDGARESARLVVLISGHGSNLQAILDAIESGELPARVGAVISNRAGAYGLERARAANLPALVHALKPYRDSARGRLEYDLDLSSLVAGLYPDWVVLAGWMHVLSNGFLSHFPNRVLNLHPALPGTFPGTDAIARALAAFRRGEIEHTGVMVHLVPDEGVDSGPVLAQTIVPIAPEDSLDTLSARVHAAEHELLVDTLRRLATGELVPPTAGAADSEGAVTKDAKE
jgi:formyltetrahydrofolate-dependent phosphoribosylglycinamide formyltransferase